jgi:hypothetical protein
MPFTLKILNATVLKRKPLPSAELPDDYKQSIAADQEFQLDAYDIERDHVRCFFADKKFKDTDVWYAFGKHIKIYEEGVRVYPKPIPPAVKLSIPYKSQRDNELNPDGSCNVTSIAMALTFLGVDRKSSDGQFEDELYDYAETNGLSRHNPHDLARVVADYGCRDDFRADGTIAQAQEWLADGKPAVIHGYFTDFGHIVTLAGYDDQGFLVHDPFGEWHAWGYDLNEPDAENGKGEYIHYSYDLIRRLCIPDDSFWLHLISKP